MRLLFRERVCDPLLLSVIGIFSTYRDSGPRRERTPTLMIGMITDLRVDETPTSALYNRIRKIPMMFSYGLRLIKYLIN